GLVGLVVATLVAVVGVGGSGDAQAGPDPNLRTLSVIGSGTVSTAPDTATWSFGVDSRGKTAAAALKKNNRTINRIVAELKKLGVARADIRTENVSVFAQRRRQKVTGFVANNNVSVVVRKLSRAGAIVAAVSDAGANNIFGPQFSLSSQDDLRKQATDAAFDQATQKAADLAAKAGVTLGQVHVVEEGSTFGGFPLNTFGGFPAAAEPAAAPPPPISPGRQQIAATLRVTFQIQ
ncbi:MAG: SIMPL domain-containing protein, partial [Gaiellaceae bacterium]